MVPQQDAVEGTRRGNDVFAGLRLHQNFDQLVDDRVLDADDVA